MLPKKNLQKVTYSSDLVKKPSSFAIRPRPQGVQPESAKSGRPLTLSPSVVYRSCMGKTITIDDDAYKLLVSLKEGAQDSFTKVIKRNIHKPLETCGEILDAYNQRPPPDIDWKMGEKILKERGRRSGGRR